MSDECPDEDEDLNAEAAEQFNAKILGFQKDYIDEAEEIQANKKTAKNVPTVLLDFTKLKINELLQRDKEHYFMNQKLFEVDCPTCKLIFDYTQICQHAPGSEHKSDSNLLENLQQNISKHEKDINFKMEAVKKIMTNLDKMSCEMTTAFTILRGQFSEVLTMFLRKDLNLLLGDTSRLSCEDCSYGPESESLSILEHTLVIVNRCLIQQILAVFSDKTDSLFLCQMVANKNERMEIGVPEVTHMCIWDEFRLQIQSSLQQKPESLKFSTLALLT